MEPDGFWNRLWQMATLCLSEREMEFFGEWGYATEIELDLYQGVCWVKLKKGFCRTGYRWFRERLIDLSHRVLWEEGIYVPLTIKYR